MKKINLMELCKDAKTIGITGHINPDGDCVSSTLALYQYLTKKLPDANIKVYLEQPSSIFNNIIGYQNIQTDDIEEIEFDIFFVMDSVEDRIGHSEKYFKTAKKTINIDHHVSNKGCCDINYILPKVSSTSEVVYELFEEDYIDIGIAEAIYTGMIHDTGVFQYSNTTPRTLEIASKLIAYGFDFSNIIDTTFYERTFQQSRILGQALLKSKLILDGKAVVSCISRSDFELMQVNSKDLDGIVNQLRLIKGVACAIFMYQIKENQYKVSLRSTTAVNVSKIASLFGGGGHLKASGCSLEGTAQEIIDKIALEIQRELDQL